MPKGLGRPNQRSKVRKANGALSRAREARRDASTADFELDQSHLQHGESSTARKARTRERPENNPFRRAANR